MRNSLPRPSDISYGGMVDGGVPMPRLERRALFPISGQASCLVFGDSAIQVAAPSVLPCLS